MEAHMKATLRFFKHLGLWLLLVTSAAAQTATGTGSIKGTVKSTSTTAAVLKGTVTVWSDPTSKTPYKHLVEVKADGTYLISNLPEGKYYLWAWVDGIGGMYYENTTDFSKAKLVEVAKDKVTENINFTVTPPPPPAPVAQGKISGKITDKNGGGLKGYLVLYDEKGQGIVKTATESTGAYSFRTLSEGSYFVEAYVDGVTGSTFYKDAADLKSATAVKVAKDQAVTGIDFSMKAGGILSGKVTDADGKVLKDVIITAVTLDGKSGKSAVTSETGEYKITGLGAGKYNIVAKSPAFGVALWYKDAVDQSTSLAVEVKDEQTTSGIDFKLPVKNTFGSVSGQVNDASGQPYTKGGYLTLTTYIVPNTKPAVRVFNAKLDATGKYKFENIPVGNYVLMLQPVGELARNYVLWYDNTTDATKAKQIEVKESTETANINFKVSGFGGTISGVITDSKGSALAEATVVVQAKATSSSVVKPILLSARTSADGKYTIQGLPDGEYAVNASACIGLVCKSLWYDGTDKGADKYDTAKFVVIANGVTTPASVNITLPLEKGTAVLSGIVKDQAGAALEGAVVTAAQNTGTTLSNSTKDSKIVYLGQVRTDATGKYRMANLPKGDYVVWVTYATKDGKYAEQWYDKAASQKEAKVVTLADAQVREDIHFSLNVQSRYATLEGAFVDASGNPIYPALIELTPKVNSASLVKLTPLYVTTTDKGAFAFTNITKGDYMLKAYGNGAEVSYQNGASFSLAGNLYIKLTASASTSTEKGSISGKVSSQVARGPVTAVLVATDLTTKKTYTTVSNNYTFTISGLPNGKFSLMTLSPGHITEYFDDQYDASKAKVLEITTAANKIEGLDISLRPGSVWKGGDPLLAIGTPTDVTTDVRIGTSLVAGFVHDVTGKAVQGATVYAMDANGEPLASAQTNQDGSYQLDDLESGALVKLFATKAGYASTTNDNKSTTDAATAMMVEMGATSHDFMLVTGTTVANESEAELPETVTLDQNYPNPFNPSTTIRFSLPSAGNVKLEVFDLLGRSLGILANTTFAAGAHEVTFQANQLQSGVYFYRLETGQSVVTKRMTLVK
jgi:protocatechuate 3,4-dioxygenase beta subunit